MYVAVKGGERAIEAAHELLAQARRGDPQVPELTLQQVSGQLSLAVDRVMAEGSLYDRELAALAIKQARGDLIEAVFLLRAFRTTLPRLAVTRPIETGRMAPRRRISATFKDLPGGQMLGPTFDYTHRLLDFALAAGASAAPEPAGVPAEPGPMPRAPAAVDPAADVNGDARGPARALAFLDAEDLIERPPMTGSDDPPDITRDPLAFPAPRAARLQNLARGDEGFLLALGYSTQRGYGRTHPFAGEIRMGEVEVEIVPEELGFAIVIGEVTVTECDMVNQFAGSATEPARFTRGYGLAFGEGERKAMAMALVDRALRADQLGEDTGAPAQDQEFVLYHSDNVEASGFVQHLKLPHYVDFQSELNLIRRIRAGTPRAVAAEPEPAAAGEED
ncbi:MAG: carbon-phosphorus lyase complex subunit PhnI [Alphaproteobacteria bacterium]|nr:carbon-phosphorus lyase complex subunit PhnI [Alphaproteobacteria bacterium]